MRGPEPAQGLKDGSFRGTISLHAKYEAKDSAQRVNFAQQEPGFFTERLSA